VATLLAKWTIAIGTPCDEAFQPNRPFLGVIDIDRVNTRAQAEILEHSQLLSKYDVKVSEKESSANMT